MMGNRTNCTAVVAIVLLIAFFVSSNAFSQTRAAELAAKQAEKAKHLAPRKPTRAEKMLMRAEMSLSGTSQGLYPFIGSAFPGGGLTFGPGYRKLFGDNGVFDVHGGYSIAGYRLAQATLQL